MSAIAARTGGRFIYALDDAYIHMAMAANLARHGVWGCTPFRFSSASSSPLWTALLGVVYALTGVHEITPLLLNLACALAMLVVSDYWLRRGQAGPATRLAALLALVLVVPMPAMVLFGMEHLLHLLLTLAFGLLAAWAVADPPSDAAAFGRQTTWLAWLAALLVASRYEGLFLVAIVCGASALRGHWRRTGIVLLSAAAPLVALGLLSISEGSLFLPNSLMLKAGGETASFWALLFKPLAPDLQVLRQSQPLSWLVIGGIAAAAGGLTAARSAWRPWVLLPAAVAGMVLLHVHYALSSTFWVYRYDAYLLGFGVIGAGVTFTAARVPFAKAAGLLGDLAVAAGVTVVGVVLVASLQGAVFPAVEVASAEATFREHYRAAQFVRQGFPGETVLVNDVGAMAFFANTRVLDIFGLCDIEPVRLRREGRYNAVDVESWTEPWSPTAAVVQLSWGWVAQRIPPDWKKVAEIEIAPEGRLLGVFATSPETVSADVVRARAEAYYRPLAAQGYHLRVF